MQAWPINKQHFAFLPVFERDLFKNRRRRSNDMAMPPGPADDARNMASSESVWQ
jgi:hypothetical protein